MSDRTSFTPAAVTPSTSPDTAARPAVSVSLGELVAALGGELLGDATHVITEIAPLEDAAPHAISFLASPKFVSHLASTQAGCVIVSPKLQEAAQARGAVIVTPDPYLYFALLTQWWARRVRPAAAAHIHPSAVIDPTAQIAEGVTIGPLAVIEAHAVLEAGVVIGSHTVVGARARIGQGTRLAPHVTFGFDCAIGARGLIHSGAVIGADGFGFAPHQGAYVKIEQLGGVRIGDDVEIGANTCIDRGALGDTVIGNGVKLDNQIQIGHNCQIGDHTAMAGCVGVAGSAKIGAHCTVGGAGMILGHLSIVDNVHISSGTLISRSIHQPGHYSGAFPFDDNASWEKNAATLRQLHALRDRLRALEKHVKS